MTSSSKIAVIFASRGMAFSQTCEELLENLEGYDYEIFFSHGLPIPDCFNEPLERALKQPFTHYWFVEEDMILPKDTLKTLLEAKVPAIMCDYPMDAQGKPAIFRDPKNRVIYGGTGCLLVTKRFINKYPKPVFHTDVAWDIKVGDVVELKERQVGRNVYGLHDVNFALEAYRRGTPIKISKLICGQRKLKNLGANATNIGQHNIETWTKLTPNTLQVSDSEFVEIEVDGNRVNVRRDSPLAQKALKDYVVFL